MARGTISYGRKANRVAAITAAVVMAFAAAFIDELFSLKAADVAKAGKIDILN